MKCPYCEREMRKGYFIDREAPVQWIPEGVNPPLFKGTLADGAVPVGSGSYWKNYTADAFYCRSCGMILLPIHSDNN